MKQLQEKHAAEVQATTKKERARAHSRLYSWIRAEMGLVLLEATGRRRGAIMGLRWEEFDFDHHRITGRAEHDKKRKTSVVPYAKSVFDAIREYQRRLGVISGPVFPGTKDQTRSAPAELLSQWIRKAEVDAELSKLEGGTCHPYRRKWRSEAHAPSDSSRGSCWRLDRPSDDDALLRYPGGRGRTRGDERDTQAARRRCDQREFVERVAKRAPKRPTRGQLL